MRRLQQVHAILSFVLVLSCTGVIATTLDVDLNPDVTLSSSVDIVGIAEQELDTTLPVDVSFSLGSAAIDLDASANVVSSGMRLDTLPTLHGEVASLPASALKDDLNRSLAQADAAIDAIRSAGSWIPIDVLYGQLKIIEKALDAQFIDLVDASVDLAPMIKARLLVIAEPIEQRYDYLKYIAYKIKSYARNEVKDEFAALLRRIVLDLADGDCAAYRTHLVGLLSDVEDYRETMIKEEEADRIRYKADSLLRKIAENGADRSCNIDLSTTIADIDIIGGLSWDEADYLAPSNDVRTHSFDAELSYSGDDWDVSIDYQQEQRDYTDRLKDDDDRTKRSLDISVSRDLEPYSADLSASLDSEYYPNYIDAEIESDQTTDAYARISDLLDRVLGLPLSATLEDRFVKDLGEEGALGALAIGDRKEAVDCLEDFIDHLLDAKWDGEIEPGTAQALIPVARSIQPRRRIYEVDTPLSLGFPFRGGDATLDLGWENKIYPADSPLDYNTSTAKVSYTKENSDLTLSAYLKREELIYPNDAAKNKTLQEWEGSFAKETACGDVTWTFFQQQATYPLASKKDQLVHKLDLDLNIDLADASIALQWTDKVTMHPNDASKAIVQVTEVGLDADWDVAQGAFSASLSDEQEWNADHTDVNLAGKSLVKETRQAELSWDGEITDALGITLSYKWKTVTDWTDPSKNVTDITLQVGFDLAL